MLSPEQSRVDAAWIVKRWTPEREEELIKLWGEQVTPTHIAERMGVSIPSVIGKANVLGLPRRLGQSVEWPDDLLAKLKQLWADGDSCSQIAKQLGKTRNAVIGKVHRIGLEGRAVAHSLLTPEERAARKLKKKLAAAAWMQCSRLEARGNVKPKTRKALSPPVIWQGSRNIPLADLQPNECRYSYSADSPFLFCAQPVVPGLSWCDHCADIVFKRVSVAEALAA